MISIFYQKQIIGDVLLITVSTKQNLQNFKIKNKNNFTLIKDGDELIGINIINFSKFLNLKNGFIYPNKEIIEVIKKVTEIDITKFIEKKFIISHVEECETIVNTHLSKCLVNDGQEKVELICGANNVKKNIKVVLVKNDAFLPNGILIQQSKIQNVLSKGMLCSYKELNINNDEGGIIVLKENEIIGNEYLNVYTNLNY